MLFEYPLLLILLLAQDAAATPPNTTAKAPEAPPLAAFKPCVFEMSTRPCNEWTHDPTQDLIVLGGKDTGGMEYKCISNHNKYCINDVGYASYCRPAPNWWVKVDTYNFYRSMKVKDESCLANGGSMYDVRVFNISGADSWDCIQNPDGRYRGTANLLLPIRGQKGKCHNMETRALELAFIPYKKSAKNGTKAGVGGPVFSTVPDLLAGGAV